MQHCEVVEIHCHAHVISTETSFVNCKCTLKEFFSLSELSRVMKHRSKISEVIRHLGMILAKACLINCERPSKKRLRLVEPIRMYVTPLRGC